MSRPRLTPNESPVRANIVCPKKDLEEAQARARGEGVSLSEWTRRVWVRASVRTPILPHVREPDGSEPDVCTCCLLPWLDLFTGPEDECPARLRAALDGTGKNLAQDC